MIRLLRTLRYYGVLRSALSEFGFQKAFQPSGKPNQLQKWRKYRKNCRFFFKHTFHTNKIFLRGSYVCYRWIKQLYFRTVYLITLKFKIADPKWQKNQSKILDKQQMLHQYSKLNLNHLKITSREVFGVADYEYEV